MAMEIIVTDLDDTLVLSSDQVNERLKSYLIEKDNEGYGIVIVSGRSIDRLDETRKWLEDNDIPHQAVHLNDFNEGPNASREFKLYKAEKLLEEGYEIDKWFENDAQTRAELRKLGINALNITSLGKSQFKAINVPEYVKNNAKRGLKYYEEGYGGDGLVAQTISDAKDLARGIVTEEKIRKIGAWIARHIVDLDAPKNNDPNDPQYPGAGLVAMLLWGGGPDKEGAMRTMEWAYNEVDKIDNENEQNTNDNNKELNKMQTKTFKADIEVKGISDSVESPYGEFTALVSVFNNVDLVNDRIIQGAFKDSLSDYQAKGKNIPIVWSHDWSNADSFIGKTLSAIETPEGLMIRGAFFNTPKAQHIRELLQERVVSEFSFAYDIIDSKIASDGVNELLKLNILEAGPTLKGANPETQLLDAKAFEIENSKAGRTISTKNENKIKDAVNLLSEVLSSLDTNSDQAKSENIENIKVEEQEQGLNPQTAITLLELEELDY